MVKILNRSGEEEKFDSKDIERNLEAAGLPERVAKEVAERVEDRVEDRWTNTKVNEQVDIELKRLEEDIERAHSTYAGQVRNTMVNADSRAPMNENTPRTEDSSRSETFIPEAERERHQSRY